KTGAQTARLTAATTDPQRASVEMAIRGVGISTPVPDIEVSPASLDFGSVTTGQSRDATLNVHNYGPADLVVRSIASSDPGYSIQAPALPFTVPAGGDQKVT